MNLSRHFRYLPVLISSCLIFLLAACGPATQPPVTTSVETAGTGSILRVLTTTTQTSTPVSTAITAPVPPTQTSCPPAGTARALVTAPLALGNHPTIVYIAIGSHTSTLNRYDVTTRKSTMIVTVSGTSLSSAQVSADGQWILFTNGPQLQAVRVDGQGLQTLYCDTTSGDFQWSTDQKLIAFESGSGNRGTIKLLRVADGAIETALTQPFNVPNPFQLRTWLDPTRLYLTQYDTDVPPDALTLLDLNKGLNQTIRDLISVVPRQPAHFQDFDSSYDGTQLFVAHSPCAYSCNGPGDIAVLPVEGGAGQTIYSNQVYSIVQVRAVTQDILIFKTRNLTFPLTSNDSTHNGLWAIHTDGTGLTRLTVDNATQSSALNGYSQYPWSNASRNGTMFAVEQQTLQASGLPGSPTLLFGSLNGGTLTPFAHMTNGSIVGWTMIA